MNPNDLQTPAPLALVGAGCFFPGSVGFDAFWQFVKKGADGITPVPPTHWNPDDFFNLDPKSPDRVYSQTGGFLPTVDFSPGDFGIAPNNLEATDTSQLFGLMAAKQALENAGYQSGIGEPLPGLKPFDRNRASVILGVTGTLELVIPLGARLGHPRWKKALRDHGVDDAVAEKVMQDISASYVPWQENSFPGLLGNVVAGRIANRFDLGGTNCVVDAACASSLGAIHLAAMELWSNRADLVISGGIDTFNDIFMFMCFSKTPALSPTGHSRPFDAEGDGTALGEGLGLVVLKRLADAERDKDHIIAVLRSIGTSSDGKGGAVYAPRTEGQMKALREAYQQAGADPGTIELVEAHGTGTKVGDAAELEALTRVFGEATRQGSWCALGSVKSQVGHTKAAAGAAGLIKAAAALYHKVLPPSIKVRRPLSPLAPGKSPFYLNSQPRPWVASPDHPRRAAVSAFGFGGSNFHCLLEEYRKDKPAPDWDGQTQILALSASSLPELQSQLQALHASVENSAWRRAAQDSRKSFNPDAPFRALFVTYPGGPTPAQLLDKALAFLRAGNLQAPTPPGLFMGQGKPAGKLALLFPGQGAQYPNMLRDLACLFPEFLDSLALANKVHKVEGHPGEPPSWKIFPRPAFTPEESEAAQAALQETQSAQPALAAVELGAFNLLRRFGLSPEMAAGHSFGELLALHAAGVFSEQDLLRLAFQRGKLVSEASTGEGGMIAVLCPEDKAAAVLKAKGISLVAANRNSPSQIVFAGAMVEIDKAEKALANQGIQAKKLRVGGAFHSPMVAAAEAPFLQSLNAIPSWTAPAFPVYANLTAKPYPNNLNDARLLLAGQLARGVEFHSMIRAMHQDGARIFLEVGPGARLTALTSEILKDQPHAAFSIDASQGKKPGEADLALALARLAALGFPVRLNLWDDAPLPEVSVKKGFTVPLCGANYQPALKKSKPTKPQVKPVPSTTSSSERGFAPAKISMKSDSSQPPSRQNPAPESLARALEVTRSSMDILQRMQEQTAQVHRQFLENQESVQRNLQALIAQQQAILRVNPADLPSFASVNTPKPAAPFALPPVAAPLPASTPPPEIRLAPTPVVPQAAQGKPAAKTLSAPASEIAKTLLDVVSEKTGYPAETLDLSMALDADLGIDSIKRVEILAAIQERLPNAPVVKPEHLGTLNSLQEVVNFLLGSNHPAAAAGPVPSPAASPAVSTPEQQTLAPVLLEIVSAKTGYPSDMLDLDMSLDADLGIDSIKRVEILAAVQERLPNATVVKPEHLGTLNTLRQVLQHLQGLGSGGEKTQAHPVVEPVSAPLAPAVALPADLEIFTPGLVSAGEARGGTTVAGQILVTGEDQPLAVELCQALARKGFKAERISLSEVKDASWDRLGGLILLGPVKGGSVKFLRQALFAAQSAGKALRAEAGPGGAFLFGVTRLDGSLGFSDQAFSSDPVNAGILGLIKTAGREWPEIRCRAIDLSADFSPKEAAEKLAREITSSGPLELAINRQGRFRVQLQAATLGSKKAPPVLSPGDLVVVTGGARGVTAECALELAREYQPTLLLLGRSPEPETEPDWLAALRTEAEIKKGLFARLGSASPREVGEQTRRILVSREIRHNLERISATGAKVEYQSLDVCNDAALALALGEASSRLGPMRGLVHGAGVLADSLIEDKTPEQFDRVFSTKVAGLQALFAQARQDSLHFIAFFSSTTARFGRSGQADYAMANEVLNKQGRQLARDFPSAKVVSFNWGPWDGGMVGEGLKKLFSKEGIGLIPLSQGARLLTDEVSSLENSGRELTVLAKGSARPADEQDALRKVQVIDILAFERVLDLKGHPFLESHVIDGRPVLPLAIMLEWLAHTALHEHPGMQFLGCDDLRVLHGVICDQAEPVKLRFYSGKPREGKEGLHIPVEARGTRAQGKEVLHARGEILLGDKLPTAPNPRAFTIPMADLQANSLYNNILFHGKMMHAIEQVDGCGDRGLTAWVLGAPEPVAWIRNPLRQRWITDPLAIDSILQLLIVWTTRIRSMGSLPCGIARLRQYRKPANRQKFKAVLEVTKSNDLLALADADLIDPAFGLAVRLEGVEGVLDASLARAFRRNRLGKTALT